MMKEVIRAFETGIIPEIGLLAFFLAFVLIVVRAFMLKRGQRDEYKNMPLDDDEYRIEPPSNGTKADPLAN
jgi:cbb3-type cytochrome oxidase subunit 3